MQERLGEKLVGAALLQFTETGADLDAVIPSGTQQVEYNPLAGG